MAKRPKYFARNEEGLFKIADSGRGSQTWLDKFFRIREASSKYSMWGPPRKLSIWKKK